MWSAGGSVVDSWCNNSVTGGDHHCTFPGPPVDPHGTVDALTISKVPEPASAALLGLGLIVMAMRRRRIA